MSIFMHVALGLFVGSMWGAAVLLSILCFGLLIAFNEKRQPRFLFAAFICAGIWYLTVQILWNQIGGVQ